MADDKRERRRSQLRRAEERLYEDSRLRDALTDEQARTILQWAESQVEREVERTIDLPVTEATQGIEERTEKIKKVVRHVNRLATTLPDATPAQSREYLMQFVDAVCEVDARKVNINDILALQEMVVERKELDNSDIFRRLMAIVGSEEE